MPALKAPSWAMTGGAALTARSPVFDALPSDLKAGREASANGPSWSKKVVSCWEEASRLCSAEPWSSATWPSAFIVGCSCSRKPGSSRKPAAMSPRRSAEACAVSLASVTKRPTSLRLAARSPTTLSALTVRSARILFCEPSVASTLSVSRSAGLARRIAALRLSALPATPAPSEPMMRLRRSR